MSDATRALTRSRLDIALPLAQFYIARARATADLRFLGYAEELLAPWQAHPPVAVRVLQATILQSRHQFSASLAQLDRALQESPGDPQAWLTRATVLRVLGRYDEALDSCRNLGIRADAAIATLCTQSLQGLSGHLRTAYAAILALPSPSLPPEARAWRYSELGEMAERLGLDAAAEHWLREGLQVAPDDLYLRAACADLYLRQGRARESLRLLAGYESMEPMLLRIAIAHRQLRDGTGFAAAAQLSSAFDVEQQRGDVVHRREQARLYLDIDASPRAAVAAALANWAVQREPDDLLILLRSARAAHDEQAAWPVRQFLRRHGLEDARLAAYLGAAP